MVEVWDRWDGRARLARKPQPSGNETSAGMCILPTQEVVVGRIASPCGRRVAGCVRCGLRRAWQRGDAHGTFMLPPASSEKEGHVSGVRQTHSLLPARGTPEALLYRDVLYLVAGAASKSDQGWTWLGIWDLVGWGVVWGQGGPGDSTRCKIELQRVSEPKRRASGLGEAVHHHHLLPQHAPP